jgi:transcriptional regulator with GAF, ATPase, and Fis domain
LSSKTWAGSSTFRAKNETGRFDLADQGDLFLADAGALNTDNEPLTRPPFSFR